MILTRIWGLVLTVLAISCLAGVFVLVGANGQGVQESEARSLRSLTEATAIAVESQVAASPVRHVGEVLLEPKLIQALASAPAGAPAPAVPAGPIGRAFAEAVEAMRVRYGSHATVALLDRKAAVIAVSGVGESLLNELLAFGRAQTEADAPSQSALVILGGQAQIIHVTRSDHEGRRLIGFEPLPVGAGSMFRRALGTVNSAGIFRNQKLVGEAIGAPLTSELERLITDHATQVPSTGASKIFVVGDTGGRWLGAMARLPSFPGASDELTIAILASSNPDARAGLTEPMLDGAEIGTTMPMHNWILLTGLGLVCAALAVYLPYLEALAPAQRLTREFLSIVDGGQHQVFYERYSGAMQQLAIAANHATEATRQAALLEFEADDGINGAPVDQGQPRTTLTPPTSRPHKRMSLAPVAGHPPIHEAPILDEPISGEHNLEPANRSSSSTDEEAALPRTGAAPPPPTPIPPKPPGSSPDDEKQAYYRQLFDEFVEQKHRRSEPLEGFTWDRFLARVEQNTSELLAAHPDARDVRFSVYVKDGKVALKAKLVRQFGS